MEWEGRTNVGMSNSVTTAIRESVRGMAIGKTKNTEKADRATVEQASHGSTDTFTTSDLEPLKTAIDPRTRMVLFKMLNRWVFNDINGCISTGKEEPSKEVVEEAGASEKEVDNSRVEDESKEAPPKPLAPYVPKVPFPQRYPTYKRITLEFLSSLKAVTHSAEGCGEGSITFQLYNQEHTWTLTKFNEVLGLPNEGPRLTSKYWSADPIWRTLTDDREYDSNNSPGNHIRHPALRYVQRLLSCTVFGRYEGGKARKDELFMLDRMLHG
uniref:Arabidopsis retrotransposon Orf1 C-terminal domain-containing protein n=1 Tax=Chenopodium quinoa TaxID=63459 RepID=A0A803MF42_CHEQI